ncbi:MAG TPA: molybdopterin-dependent oxidoreductase [Gemmatimonadaceae bacterium]
MGTPLGRGGASTFPRDVANANCILIMGSNFAECHPVAFRFALRAREHGAELVHVDPRFNRTSAHATQYAQIRAGTDIAFLGALVNHVLHSERWNTDPFFQEYVRRFTNAATIIERGFRDVGELGGMFSGWEDDHYCPDTWQYEGTQRVVHLHERYTELCRILSHEAHSLHGGRTVGGPPPRDPTLQDPRCVLQLLRRHFAPYTPEAVSEICGVPAERITRVAETLLANSGADRTTAVTYAVGWTQHTTGPQIIATAAILQLLLGNIGRPGGGILVLRGHATIQGSTDIPTLYDMLPGYLHMPTELDTHATLDTYIANEGGGAGQWGYAREYLVSLLKAYFGEAATAENDFCYEYLPRIDGDYSHFPMFVAMHEGRLQGLFLMGQNPAVGGPNAEYQREGLRRLRWLVVRDIFLTESATAWESDPAGCDTEVFLLPAATVVEKDGSFTNTHRLIQWHDKAVEPPGDARSDAWFVYHLGRRLKALYRRSSEPRDRPIQALTWDYPLHGDGEEPVIDYVLREINGYTWAPTWSARAQLQHMADLRADGSTACGCWLYAGVHTGRNVAAARVPDDYVSPGWGFSWPNNVRLLYNRASADALGNPWSEEKKYVWWDEVLGRWTGLDVPDFPAEKRPDDPGDRDATGMAAVAGDSPFVMKPDGKGWLFFPFGMKDGPMPTHYEPWETPVHNALYAEAERNPVTKHWDVPGNPYNDVANPAYPHVITTYRLTEHHTGGGMTRWNSWLAELQPGAFVEISPELAAEEGIEHLGWVTLRTARGEAEARAFVTRRMRPLSVQGRVIHQIGFPWHFGGDGIVTGDSANLLASMVADPNVSIHEGKVFTCAIRAGRLTGDGARAVAGAGGGTGGARRGSER